jgi:hypothetical protein
MKSGDILFWFEDDWIIKNEKYNIDDYLININEQKFSELFENPQNDEKMIMWLNMDISLQRQYNKIPKVFQVPTILYTRFDLDVPEIIKYNYERKEIAKMKQIIDEESALYNSMLWNFDRVKYDAELKENNKDNNNLKIKYLVSGWEDNNDIVDEIILFNAKNK